jgi:hypothetical protein
MPKVEVFTTYVTKVKSKDRSYEPGSIVDVDDAEEQRLVERGLARSLDAEAKAKVEAEARALADAEAAAKAKADEEAAAKAKAEQDAAKAPAGGQLPLGSGDAPGT